MPIVLVVLVNGLENVNIFSFVVNIVVDVAFKLLIDKVEFVDNEFKLVIVAYVVKSGLFIIVVFQSD